MLVLMLVEPALAATVAVAVVPAEEAAIIAGDVAVAVGCPPVKARAASSLGWALPKPQPPSRSCATTGPAHLPELKPQQAEAQSASLLHAPVMNCVPWPRMRVDTVHEQ
jgi:hypothetical protein